MDRLRLATWNVKTMKDENRRVKIFQELNEQNIDIACLQETRFLGNKFSNEHHKIFGLDGNKGTCPHGVGFAMKKKLLNMKDYDFNPDSNRLSVIKLKKENNIIKYINIINVYAPVNDAEPDSKDFFYSCLEYVFSLTPPSEAVFIIGDFNAHVGADNVAWPTCLGPFGVGEINDNGQRLLEFCSLHDLCVLNTYTELPESEQFTYRSSIWKTWSQVDLCITRISDRHTVISTKPVNNLIDETFDHKMVILEIDTSLEVQSIEPNLETIQLQTLFRYLLTSLVQIVTSKKHSPAESLLKSEINDTFTVKLFSGEIDYASQCIKLLKDSIDKIEKWFNSQDNIFPKEDITNSIKNVSHRFFKEKLEVNAHEQELFLEQVDKYLTECLKTTTSGSEDILKFEFNSTAENVDKFVNGKQIDPSDGEILKAVTLQWCNDCVLPEELLYIFIYMQCMNIANPTTTFQSTDLCSTLRHLLAQCMLIKFQAIVTDDILQGRDIFICRSEKDMLFALNRLQEKCLYKNKTLYIAFVDLSKILTSGKRPTSVKSLTVRAQWTLYLPILCDNTSGNNTQPQSELMKYLLSYILDQSFNGLEATLELKYNFHAKLFKGANLNAENTPKFCLRAIQYDSYAAIFATTKEEIEKCLEKVEITCNSFGLSFLQNNPLVLVQNIQTTEHLHIGSEQVYISKSVNFLGMNFTSEEFSLDKDIYLRIHNTCKRLQTLHIIVPKNTDLDIDSFFPDLKCNLEFLCLKKEQENALDSFYARCLRRLKLLPKSDSISRYICLASLALLGDYYRDKSDSINKRLLYGERVNGTRWFCYFKNLRANMRSLKINVEDWESIADNKEEWKSKIETKL